MLDFDALIKDMIKGMIDDAFIQVDAIVSHVPAVSKATDELEEWLGKHITDTKTYNETVDKILAFEYSYSRTFFSMGIKTGIRLAENSFKAEGSTEHGLQ